MWGYPKKIETETSSDADVLRGTFNVPREKFVKEEKVERSAYDGTPKNHMPIEKLIAAQKNLDQWQRKIIQMDHEHRETLKILYETANFKCYLDGKLYWIDALYSSSDPKLPPLLTLESKEAPLFSVDGSELPESDRAREIVEHFQKMTRKKEQFKQRRKLVVSEMRKFREQTWGKAKFHEYKVDPLRLQYTKESEFEPCLVYKGELWKLASTWNMKSADDEFPSHIKVLDAEQDSSPELVQLTFEEES